MSIDYNPDNIFMFSFVRMNPPTPGHLSLIGTMINKAIELGSSKIYIITSSSLDGKNPLPCSSETIPKPKTKADGAIISSLSSGDSAYKSEILTRMIASYRKSLIDSETDEAKKDKLARLNIIVLCSKGSPFGFIDSVINSDFVDRGIPKVNMFFIVGRDRADFLDTIVDSFKMKPFIASIDGMVLEREGMEALKSSGMGTRSISEINPSEYSASFVRKLVKNNQLYDFMQVYGQYLSPEETEKMYKTIHVGMQMKSPTSKEEDENPQSKYFDGKELPIVIAHTSGGRKRMPTKRRTLTKKRKTKRRKTKTKRRLY
jgi:hypothetical protein